MRSTLNKVLIFTAGAAIGSVVTWKIVKTKYEQIAQDEIDSVKEVFSKRTIFDSAKAMLNKNEYTSTDIYDDTAEVRCAMTKDKPDIREYAAKLQESGYTDYSNTGASTEKGEINVEDAPYVIAPEEFGELEDYDTISLIYYADEYLTDDQNVLVEDVDDVVGLDSLDHFGEYEDDSVFVRNDRLKADYEILLDPRNYRDVINRSPHSAEVE